MERVLSPYPSNPKTWGPSRIPRIYGEYIRSYKGTCEGVVEDYLGVPKTTGHTFCGSPYNNDNIINMRGP